MVWEVEEVEVEVERKLRARELDMDLFADGVLAHLTPGVFLAGKGDGSDRPASIYITSTNIENYL